MFHEILVIGGGASGIMASIALKDMGKDVGLIEGSNRIGSKILTTGNGRCNITNKNINYSRYHSKNPGFYKHILDKFTVDNTIDFFYSLGLPLTELDDGKLYPLSLQASSVLDILRMALDDRSVPIYLNEKIKTIKKSSSGFKVLSQSSDIYECKKLILCCGGNSAPNTGSDGSGFELVQRLNHSIITPVPSLVQLKLKYNHLKALSGVKFNGFAEIYVDDAPNRKEFGEILFTDYGISGPPILQISSIASRALAKGKEVRLTIDMMPNLDKEALIEFLENHWALFSYRSILDSFIGIINKKIIPTLLKEASITNIHKPCYELTWKEKNKIFFLLKNWGFMVYDTNSFKNSQVTSGGINTEEVNSKTLESEIVSNLFFAGEILDVDGDCGGFNLQWCWSSGFIAAKSAAD
ncbi:NAD(P)/FAD-dependent oxidoreductase [Clostridium drakei]|uniref:Aminoacetone oxidase family FAD-binding enzyme n=1 Tax=Clostridium drakei TaxID=332101 RepID=A0A2U8DXS5_9CLOT|nr:NAD(P)/FAD-dependent oxidoreductase [Clostridium drakei]AWI07459.1 aminoacetone oxidase family FAD-binding enzyme [Clostridium drakei]